MFKMKPISSWTRRTLALTAILGASFAVMGAQNVAPAASGVVAQPVFSSSSADDGASNNEVASNASHFNFVDAMQYGGRQSYGRPRYRGGNTNPDGSAKWTGFGGVGIALPVQDTSNYLTPSYGLQVGFGRQWSNHFMLPIEFDYDHFGFQGSTLANQTTIYNSPNVFGAGAISGLDGSSHVWSFSLDPTYTITSGQGLGAYVVGGVGFYHKTANFTVPATGTYCDYYYGCFQYAANETIDKYTSNAPGFSGGLGLTYKFSRFSGERFYIEGRYVYVLNSARPGFTVANESQITATSTNLYPANSNRTSYFPIKVGIRF